jgi:hypothetical protein
MSQKLDDRPNFPAELSRRQALGTLAVGLAGASARGEVDEPSPRGRPRVAAIVTEYRNRSHGQGIVDRFIEGHGWGGRFHRPAIDVVSLYVDQRPAGDLSRERASRHPELKIYPTIAEALACGRNRLAVDGVMVIAEQGRYPRNDKGQTLYPRYEFFQQVADVFRRSGRAVPVFNDKHLSWRWDWTRTMVETSRELGFPMLAGSSLPVTWRIPSVDLPWEAVVEEVVCVGYGGVDSYDFHGLETLQCMVERRRGGETGVQAVQAFKGDAVWKALGSGSWGRGGCSRDLFEACLCRSFTLASPRPGYGHAFPELDQWPALVPRPYMYRIEYADGLRGTLVMLPSGVRDFTVAVRIKGMDRPLSTQMYLPGLHPGQTLPNFFSALAHQIETLFLTGKPPYPVERTLLTTGILAAAVDSLSQGQSRIETPHLKEVHYRPGRESTFMRS